MYVKFLNSDGSSHYDSSFFYSLPMAGGPGDWIQAPGDCPTDNEPCGPNRLHVCNQAAPRGGAEWGVPYEAEIEGVVGSDEFKTSARGVRLLRQISITEIIHPGANLSGANLSRADLYRANLSGANLSGADFYEANLSGAKGLS